MAAQIIRVITEILYSSSEKISNLSGQISSSVSELSSALDGVRGTYDGQLEAAVGSRVAQAQGAGNNMASRVGESSADLEHRATAFDQADNAALDSVLGISTSVADLRTKDPAIGSWVDLRNFPHDLLQLLLSGMALVPGYGLAKLIVDRVPSLRGLLGWNGATFTNLRWPWTQTQKIISPLPDSAQTEQSAQEKGGFGPLLDKMRQEQTAEKERLAEQANATQNLEQTRQAEQLTTTKWDYEWKVPLKSQQDLELNGKPTEYGCAPTATSMVLDYWNSKDPEKNKTLSSQELIDLNAKQGEFTPTGMSVSNMKDELQNLGYHVAQDHTNATIDELRDAVSKGPVIATVKLGLGTSGYNHSVVVTGISPTQVEINDPWEGKAKIMPIDQFEQTWGADFGSNAPKNNFFEIRPG
ncbi:C39 family peptidase [Petrachloros mirabilis]